MKRKSVLYITILIATLVVLSSIRCRPKEDSILGYFKLDTGGICVTSLEEQLDVPWEVQYHKGVLWYSLQKGEVWYRNLQEKRSVRVLTIPSVFRLRTLGALGMNLETIHDSTFVYLVYNTISDTSKVDTSTLRTSLFRYYYDKGIDSLVSQEQLLSWPANTGHNGSRILIGKHNDLFVTTGDRAEDMDAQNTNSLNGKVLHLLRDGSVPKNNPFPGSYIWSYGHRNQQGICFGKNGLLYASEHGDASDDEVNLIESGKNYGWPIVEGHIDTERERKKIDSSKLHILEPIMDWTPTIAPAAIIYYGQGPIQAFRNSLLLVTLKGSALHVIHLDASGRKATSESVYFKNRFGRLRSISIDEKGNVYIGTSNRDWNPGKGFPKSDDDQILKLSAVDPKDEGELPLEQAAESKEMATDIGKNIYMDYCSSCHKEDGKGLAGSFPPLFSNSTLKNTEKLVDILMHGRTGEQRIQGATYSQAMPSFSFLTIEQQFSLVNYLKTHFVNDAKISEDELKKIRNKVSSK